MSSQPLFEMLDPLLLIRAFTPQHVLDFSRGIFPGEVFLALIRNVGSTPIWTKARFTVIGIVIIDSPASILAPGEEAEFGAALLNFSPTLQLGEYKVAAQGLFSTDGLTFLTGGDTKFFTFSVIAPRA